MNDLITLRVDGTPRPVARRGAAVRGGRTVTYPRGRGHEWKAHVMVACRQMNQTGGLSGRLEVGIEYILPRPKDHYHNCGRGERGGELRASHISLPHISKPDLDNLNKGTLDGLVHGGLIKDDRFVVQLLSFKRYNHHGEPTGAIITIGDASRCRSTS